MRTEVADLEAEKIQRMEALAGINNKAGATFPQEKEAKGIIRIVELYCPFLDFSLQVQGTCMCAHNVVLFDPILM
jgi:predicted ArsR family transcriptional regulator